MKWFTSLVAVVVCICTVPLSAIEIPYITGTSSATLIDDGGPYNGWYLYEIEIEWDLNSQGAGLSHWDLILKADCGLLDHLIEFDVPAGYSTSESEPDNPLAMGWTGYFVREGDTSLDPAVTKPVVKYNNPFYPETAKPGPEGYGTFSFYANIIPEYKGPYENALVAKAGTIPDTYGTLTGAYPSCTIIPEPATVMLLGLGALTLLKRRKR